MLVIIVVMTATVIIGSVSRTLPALIAQDIREEN